MGYKTKYKLVIAHHRSYGGERALHTVTGIVIHNTGNVGDTAAGNCHFFSPSGTNTRSAGAHIFISRNGDIVQSIPFEYKAYAVGDKGVGKYKNKFNNSNTISIELCDIATKDVSSEQINALKDVIQYIQSICSNAKSIIRHYDITRKSCPVRYLNDSKWLSLRTAITGGGYVETPRPLTPSMLNVDGYVGELTIRLWQRIMGTPEDGEIWYQRKAYKKYHMAFVNGTIKYSDEGGSNLIKAVQRVLGVDDDGILGTDTIKAIQVRVGVYADGYFGRQTATALQERLNQGMF